MRKSLLVLFVAVLTAFPVAAQRLSTNVVPSNYKLHFVPDLATETFRGEETITVAIAQPTSAIVLHALEIEFDDVTVTAGGRAQKATVTKDAKSETATLTLPAPVPAGAATIDIRYRGLINDKLRGLYISKTPRRKYAVTQLQATDARRMFPSFDEPAMKATYDLIVVVDAGDTAISNAPIAADVPGPGEGKHTIVFGRTQKMSTYLVALLIGDWQCAEGTSDDIPIRVCAVPEKKDLTRFGLAAAEHQLKWFNDYYGIRYPFRKLDVAGLPDFEAGAMENAGAITFRESMLLMDEQTAPPTALRFSSWVMSHEIAHMWFGDLVTMQWWDDIWLNEGFATWISTKPLKEWRPSWRLDVEEAQYTTESLGLDAMESTRPIRAKATTSGEINQLFDGIAYGKTAAVLRMLEAHVGETSFRDGIRAYISKYSYANARAEDFWTTMAQVSKQPVDKIMPTYVDQAGLPLVSAKATCSGGKTNLTLSQRRMFSRAAPFAKATNQLWMIPVAVKDLDRPDAAPVRVVLSKKQETFELPGCRQHLFINHEGTGFYRAEHAPELLAGVDLTAALSAAEKIALLDGSWALVQNGRTDIARHLQLIESFRNDRERVVVSAIGSQLGEIGVKLVTDKQRPAFQRFVAGYARPLVNELGWAPVEGESEDARRMRVTALRMLAVTARDADALQKARELARKSFEDPKALHPSLVDEINTAAALRGDAAHYETLLARMAAATNPQDYYRAQRALASFEDPALTKRALALALAPEMKSQDLPGFLSQLLAQPYSRVQAWSFIRDNWSALEKKFTMSGGAYVVSAAGSMCDAQQRADVARWFAAHPVEASERALKQALEKIDTCVELRTMQSASFGKWLAARTGA